MSAIEYVHYEERVTHIGLFGLPVYEVLVVDEERDGALFCHTEIVWGYERACRRAWAPTSSTEQEQASE